MQNYKQLKNELYKKFLISLNGKIDKINLSYIEIDFVKGLIKSHLNVEFLEEEENYKDDGAIFINGKWRRVEFKRMHDYEYDKNIFKIRKFFHTKNVDVIWIEYSEKFNWVRIYDLYKISYDNFEHMNLNGDTAEFDCDVFPFFEIVEEKNGN